jgi:nitrite reductase/ring-hydroxylating ferredoxin subunit
MTKTKIATTSELSTTKALKVKAGGQSILVATANGHACAIANKCPHLGLPMSTGKIENGIITCPFHGSKFDMKTGKNVEWVNAVMGIPLPAMAKKMMSMGKEATDIPCFSVTQEGEDLFIDV